MKKLIFLLLTIIVLSSCKQILVRLYGVKKPKIESNETVVRMLEKEKVYYDYLFRLKSINSFNIVQKQFEKANSIIITDNDLNVLVTEDSSLCHMGVRSTGKQLIRNSELILKAKRSKNLTAVFQKELNCINCKKTFDFSDKKIIVLMTYAKFLGFNDKVSDIDFINELKEENLLDKVNVVLVNMDFVEE